jgi:hypothetical protein
MNLFGSFNGGCETTGLPLNASAVGGPQNWDCGLKHCGIDIEPYPDRADKNNNTKRANRN